MESYSISNSRNETHVSVEISEVKRTQQQILQRVPLQLRKNKNRIYDPMVLSLGPYHPNNSPNSKFFQVEEFKNEAVNIMLEPSTRGLFRTEIRCRVDEIRIFYKGLAIYEYNDEELTEMMLRDTCFILYYMQIVTGNKEKWVEILYRLGLSVAIFLSGDMFMLENQIPLWVLNLLISLKSSWTYEDKDKLEGLLYKFLSYINFVDYRLTRVPWEGKDQEPRHLLEALRYTAINGEISGTSAMHHRRTSDYGSSFKEANSLFRSVSDLKIKGIHFGPSSSCITDIRFNSYWFYGKLQLPFRCIDNNSEVLFSNLIALEMSPENDINDASFAIMSYVNVMKSLIESPKDVKELREKGILLSSLRNDEEVVKIFKGVETYGIDNRYIFREVKVRIN